MLIVCSVCCGVVVSTWYSQVGSICCSLGPDAIVEESEQIPLGGSFGLEIPEDPSLDHGFGDIDLGFDVVGGGSLHIVVPFIDEVLGRT